MGFRYIVKGNLFAPVVEAFIRNNGRYNLLESAILELFEFIKLEDIKVLCTYVVENFGKIFDEIQYVQTFKNLRNKYDQHQDRIKDKEKGYDRYASSALVVAQIMSSQRSIAACHQYYERTRVTAAIKDSLQKKKKCGSTKKMTSRMFPPKRKSPI